MLNSPNEILIKLSICLNQKRHKEAVHLLKLFDRNFRGIPLTPEIIFSRLYLEAELAIRTGIINDTLNNIKNHIKIFNSFPELKFKLLLKAGQIETMSNKMGISTHYFTEALGLAEEIGDSFLIAIAYQHISKMFAPLYTGLSLYFIRKAEIKFKNSNRDMEAYICQMERALIYSVYVRTRQIDDKIEKILISESKKIVAMVFNENLNEFEEKHCRYIRAFVNKDEKELLELIEGLKDIDALPIKCKYEEMYIGICAEKGLWTEADAIFQSYMKDCMAYHISKENVRTHIQALKEIIKNKKPANFIPFHLIRNIDSSPNLFDILDHYALADEIWSLDKGNFRVLFPSYEQEGKFEAIEMPDGSLRLFPCGLAFNVFYRGQSIYYDKSYPSIFREDVSEAQRFVERIKYEELKRLINEYPITLYFKQGFVFKTPEGEKPIQFSVDALALAQHYGIRTELMDLTSDKFVAAFFATTRCINDTYFPITDNPKEQGVFYRYCESIPNYSKLSAVGLQPFSRPGEQCGYVYKLKKGENFNDLVTSKDFFEHNATVSEFIFNYTNRSKKLFPESILTKHAKEIAFSKTFSFWAFKEAKNEFYPNFPDEILYNYLKEENVKLKENLTFRFTEEEKILCEKEWKETGYKNTVSKIICRFIYKNDNLKVGNRK